MNRRAKRTALRDRSCADCGRYVFPNCGAFAIRKGREVLVHPICPIYPVVHPGRTVEYAKVTAKGKETT
jgi:hypothetical protein